MKGKRIRMSLRFAYGLRRLFVHWALLVFLGLGAPALAQDVHILAFGDSLTAGHGLPRGQGFAPQLEQALRRNGIRTFVTDAGVSGDTTARSEEHTSELQSLMRISYAVFCLKKKNKNK